MQTKNPAASKTLWFNIPVLIIGVWDQLAPFLPEKVHRYALPVVALANAILRFLTSQPLKGGAKGGG